MTPEVSILISSYNRLALFRRTLWSIAYRPPPVPFEVVVADDGSTEDIAGLLREFSSCFQYTLIEVDGKRFEAETGIQKFHNNPAWTNNIAFRYSRGEKVFLMGNEIIAWDRAFASLLDAVPAGEDWLLFSTTYDIEQRWLDLLDENGSNLNLSIIGQCQYRPLQSVSYRSDVTNYLSLCPRSLWERLDGYDERYVAGISADDSDFVRRARALGAKTAVVPALSLHQYHQGKSRYYDPPPAVITSDRWEEGVRINHAIYHGWDGTHHNRQPWPWGHYGVKSITRNFIEGQQYSVTKTGEV